MLLLTIPHSGEQIPEQAFWLKALPEVVLMRDVDRYVDRLYEAIALQLGFVVVKTQWHRYAVDLNRTPEDIDQSSVEGAHHPAGLHSRGYHWVITTKNENLLSQPISWSCHQQLTDLIYHPFHRQIHEKIQLAGSSVVYHLDVHSMPSRGTDQHRDPGEMRADIVISDCGGTSADLGFRDKVILAYVTAGFKVAYNWPYLGGRVTEQYGRPQKGHHTLQVELNRALYMDEQTQQWLPEKAQQVQDKIKKALIYLQKSLPF